MSIVVSICIQHLEINGIFKWDYKNEIRYTHIIQENMLNMMKNSWNGRVFESPLFDNMWKLKYYPNITKFVNIKS